MAQEISYIAGGVSLDRAELKCESSAGELIDTKWVLSLFATDNTSCLDGNGMARAGEELGTTDFRVFHSTPGLESFEMRVRKYCFLACLCMDTT